MRNRPSRNTFERRKNVFERMKMLFASMRNDFTSRRNIFTSRKDLFASRRNNFTSQKKFFASRRNVFPCRGKFLFAKKIRYFLTKKCLSVASFGYFSLNLTLFGGFTDEFERFLDRTGNDRTVAHLNDRPIQQARIFDDCRDYLALRRVFAEPEFLELRFLRPQQVVRGYAQFL